MLRWVTLLWPVHLLSVPFFIALEAFEDVRADTLECALLSPLYVTVEAFGRHIAHATVVVRMLLARCVASSRAAFRQRLKEDLSKHASWAHKLTRAAPHGVVPTPGEQLGTLHSETLGWEAVWTGCPAPLPDLVARTTDPMCPSPWSRGLWPTVTRGVLPAS